MYRKINVWVLVECPLCAGILEIVIFFIILLKNFNTIKFCLPSKNDLTVNAGKCNLVNREKGSFIEYYIPLIWSAVDQVDPASAAKVSQGGREVNWVCLLSDWELPS